MVVSELDCGGLPPEICEQLSREEQVIKIRVDMRKFGKAVTVVEGLPSDKETLKSIAKALKTKLAAGGTYRDDGVIELQGDHRHRVKEILVNEFGFPPENVLIVD
ncbi:MAG: stress response translation initiation inhibitor YciH [Thermogladius sp.]|jgi:translation initiation factor 1|uniref:Protein translation factor SUI1 homolog n=1 Tax=Thermogladius calderae TaxID=1200300 RepID=A0A7J3XY28_9CREN|nr:stress response translation initiation inhibitor YciH [Thermogladius sp.]